MRLPRVFALGASVLVLVGACSTGGSSSSPGTSTAPSVAPSEAAPSAAAPTPAADVPAIKIGSVGFDEARVVAEVYAQALEASGYKVDRAGIGLGARKVLLPALESGQIDLEPEYIGSGLAYYAPGTQTGDPAKNQTLLQAALTPKAITVLGYTPGQDTNAFVVRKETADQFSLTKVSDLTAHQADLKFGLATDCPTNPVCAAALKSAYGLDPENVTLIDACSGPMADALKLKTVDVAELCSTGPEIIVNGWVRLEDDKSTQPADNLAPLVRDDYLAKVDKAAFSKILDDVSAKIDTPILADLYKQVAVDKKDLAVVAKTWLTAQGFVK